MNDLRSKIVLITGAAGGLGKAVAQGFASEGCELFLTDQNERRLCEFTEVLRGKGVQVASAAVKLSGASEAQEIVNKALQAFGRIEVLVNNAGVAQSKPFLELTEADWNMVFDVNVKALFFMLQATAKQMLEHGGCIVNVASVSGRLPRPAVLHYAASKAAVISITRSAALALARHNIRVNAIAPGMIDTEMLQGLRSGLDHPSAGQKIDVTIVPLGRIAQPPEIAAAVLYLASDNSSYITGQTLNVCGGISMV